MKGCLKENAGTEGLEIEINLTKHAKEQLLEGFAFRHVPGLYSYSPTKLELHFEELKNEFDVNGGTAFKGLCDELYAELIGGEIMEEQKSGSKVTVIKAYEKLLELSAEDSEDGITADQAKESVPPRFPIPLSGPKKLGTFGASYLYPIFIKLGLITEYPMLSYFHLPFSDDIV